jgi:hypothetical protein
VKYIQFSFSSDFLKIMFLLNAFVSVPLLLTASMYCCNRALVCGLIAAGAGASLGPDIASAASKRRPPPPSPTEEKQDPNVSGVLAKVLASKRRKEAMKEAVAKLREKGKPVDK